MGPGGPGNPMQFGKSRAKFQVDANTGVTFDDVAGVDEAKQDFMEVLFDQGLCPPPQLWTLSFIPHSCRKRTTT